MALRRTLAGTATLLLAFALIAGCEEKPVTPAFDNPLDPEGPGGGDPFAVTAVFQLGKVFVSWQDPGVPGIAGYEVFHSLEPDQGFGLVASVEAGTTSASHEDFSPNLTNYYKVRALDGEGGASAISNVVAAAITPPPLVAIGDTNLVFSRLTTLTLRSALGGDVQVDSTAAFATPTAAAIEADVPLELAWDLGPAAADGERKHVYVRVGQAGAWSAAGHDSVTVDFAPTLRLPGNAETVASRTPAFEILGAGVTQMRFAAARDLLPAAAWLPGAATHDGFELPAEPGDFAVLAEFACDFGFTVVDSLGTSPDPLAEPELILAGGAATTSEDLIPLTLKAVALEMRLAGTPLDLAAAPWQPYAASADFAHDGCAGGLTKTVLAQFRNDWYLSEAVSAEIVWAPPEPPLVDIADPGEVLAATTVLLTGTAAAGTCPLDLVEIDAGDGWQPATGLADWSFSWNVPAWTEDTQVVLRARVTAGEVAAEDSLEITVTGIPTP